MNLKLVAVSMSVLGLISSPVFADTTTTTTTVKHHGHHQQQKHHRRHHDYKAMGAMPMQSAPAAEIQAPVVSASMTSMILDQMNQNVNNPKPMPEWFNRIGVSGGINFDTGKWGSRSITNAGVYSETIGSGSPYNSVKAGYAGENTKRFSLNDVYLNVSADVNEMTKAFASLAYTDTSINYDQAYTSSVDNTQNTLGVTDQRLNLEQGYVRFANFDCTPFFLEIGKEFQDFSRYDLHPITASMTQALSETLRNAVKLGFITDMGIHGSAYTFQDPIYRSSDSNNKENTLNYGAALGYAHPDDQFGYDVGLGYLYNMFGVNDIGAVYAAGTNGPAYHDRVGSVAAYADLNYDVFTLGARYTTATQHFSSLDIPKSLANQTSGAKPWAAGIQAGYNFNAWERNQNVYLGYQASRDTEYLNLPQSRLLVGYGINVLKNTTLAAEWDHDYSYSIAKGGPQSGNSNLVSVRAAVKFG